MYRGPDMSIVAGSFTRYSCRTVAEVDSHLRALTAWLRRPSAAPARSARLYRKDIDVLLDARVMLMALATLDEDIGDLDMRQGPGGVSSRAPCDEPPARTPDSPGRGRA